MLQNGKDGERMRKYRKIQREKKGNKERERQRKTERK